jgi:hypothetical protein
MMSDVLNVHLISGEDVIGDCTFTDDGFIVVTAPVLPNISMQMSEDGRQQFGVGLLHLRPYLSEVKTITIPSDKVLWTAPVGLKFEMMYRQFTSGITLATRVPDMQSSLVKL